MEPIRLENVEFFVLVVLMPEVRLYWELLYDLGFYFGAPLDKVQPAHGDLILANIAHNYPNTTPLEVPSHIVRILLRTPD